METTEAISPDASAFLDRALARVESVSIRAWARTEHNLPLMLRLATIALSKGGNNPENELRFATFVTCEAMGL